MKFKIGEVVVLKSGGPPMTVRSLVNEWVCVEYFDGMGLRNTSFRLAMLTHTDHAAKEADSR